MLELLVPVGVTCPLFLLGIGLEGVAYFMEQATNSRRRARVSLLRESSSQAVSRRRPTREETRDLLWSQGRPASRGRGREGGPSGSFWATSPHVPHPSGDQRPSLHLGHALGDGVPTETRDPGHSGDAAVSPLEGEGPRQDSSLAFVKEGPHGVEGSLEVLGGEHDKGVPVSQMSH